jgi:ribonuclease HI
VGTYSVLLKVSFLPCSVKKFNTLGEAEEFMKSDKKTAPKPGTAKFYGVQSGHVPGVYTDYASVLEQVTGFKGGKQKSFATWEEAQAYVNEGRSTPSDISTPISLKGHLESTTISVDTSRRSSKKPKKNDDIPMFPETNGNFEPGTGPLPPNAEDGFDDRIKLPTNRTDGLLEFKTEAELHARKKQPTGYFEGCLEIWTDGAAKGNGKAGAAAGIGIWFGHDDAR